MATIFNASVSHLLSIGLFILQFKFGDYRPNWLASNKWVNLQKKHLVVILEWRHFLFKKCKKNGIVYEHRLICTPPWKFHVDRPNSYHAINKSTCKQCINNIIIGINTWLFNVYKCISYLKGEVPLWNKLI